MRSCIFFCGITHRSPGFTVTDIGKPSRTLLSIICRSVISQNAKQLEKQQEKGRAAVVLVVDGGSGAPILPSTCTTVMHGMHKGFQSSQTLELSFFFPCGRACSLGCAKVVVLYSHEMGHCWWKYFPWYLWYLWADKEEACMVILAKGGQSLFMKLLIIAVVPKAEAKGDTMVLSGLVITLLELETLQWPDAVSP